MTDETRPIVLMVEDDMLLRDIADRVFKTEFDATSCEDARSALSYMTTHHPDAILLDIMLPDISGFELLERWRTDQSLNDIAIVMFTNLSDSSDRKKAMDLGADGYYIKANLDVTDLPDLIRKHIKKRRNPGWSWLPSL